MTGVAREGKVHVRSSECDQCLLTAGRIVPGERARQLIRDTRAEEGASFICHKSQVSAEPPSICRGWFDRFGDEDPYLRLASGMGVVDFTTGADS